MKAVIKLDIPDYQIGQEVSVYFKDTMCIKGVCQEDSTIEELKKIKAEIEEVCLLRGIDQIVDNIKEMNERLRIECDNDHDCEHCDWVECPLDKENKE